MARRHAGRGKSGKAFALCSFAIAREVRSDYQERHGSAQLWKENIRSTGSPAPFYRRSLLASRPAAPGGGFPINPMIISANQPYFCPFPGFFYKALLSDALVILDEVQFPQGATWINRNRFKNDQGPLWLTIPVWKKGLGLQNINRVEICYEGRWPRKRLESLRSAYGNSPYLADHLPWVEEMLASRFAKLLDLNMAIISYLMNFLQIKTRLVLLSELAAPGRGTRLLIEICRAMGASTFLVQSQAQKYLDAGLFQEEGIELRAFKYQAPVYPQLWGDFLANLSAFDLVFNCGPQARKILLRHQPAISGFDK